MMTYFLKRGYFSLRRTWHKTLNTIQYWDEKTPSQIIIMLTNPRAGSTWLFDAIRQHPSIHVYPTAIIYHRLGLNGRRYPLDLVISDTKGYKIETRPRQWEYIPSTIELQLNNELMGFAIEKIHPHFFQWDNDRFLRNVERLGSEANVQFLYQIREPEESLQSMISYSMRNPRWMPGIDHFIYMVDTYKSLYDLARRLPGPIITYDTLKSSMDTVLNDIFGHLWPDIDSSLAVADIQRIQEHTRREKRARETHFIGNNDHDLTSLFERYRAELEQCKADYLRTIQLIGANESRHD